MVFSQVIYSLRTFAMEDKDSIDGANIGAFVVSHTGSIRDSTLSAKEPGFFTSMA